MSNIFAKKIKIVYKQNHTINLSYRRKYMLKKLFIALVFSAATFVWSGSSFAGGHCVGTTMSDALTGGKYPQQYELSEYESAAGCTMKFSDNPNIASINATIQLSLIHI